MTKAEALKQIEAGEPMFLVEYRSTLCERFEFRDKDTGKPASFTKVTHNVEMGNRSFAVAEKVQDADPATYKSPFKKGQPCAFHVVSYGTDRQGKAITSGKLEPLN